MLEILPISFATLGVSLVLYSYLEGRLSVIHSITTTKDKSPSTDILSNKVKDFEKQLNLIYAKTINKDFSEEKIKDTIQDMINSISSESILTKVKTEYGNEIIKDI